MPWQFVPALVLAPRPPLLTFDGFFRDLGGRLAPTAKLSEANGTRVRMVGFVADVENPPKGGFWLCPRPSRSDESGGGTGDLPLESVFVVVRSSPNVVFGAPHRPVEVVGRLEVGPGSLPDGTMTHLRLLLDRSPSPLLPPSARAKRPVRLPTKP